MASLKFRRFITLSFAMAAMLIVGCASETSMVGELPSPNFSGPVTAAPVRVAPAAPVKPQAVAPIKPPAKAPSMAGIPRDWMPPVAPRAWQAIVIHHSATHVGGATRFDREHRERGWDELGYDFVIGNGTDTADGQIEVGPRWTKQKIGAHAKTPDNWFNEHGIGICLVGNFDGSRPTAAQMRSLSKLVAHMMRTYHIPASQIVGHGDTKSTDCPGRLLSVAEVRRQASQLLLAEGVTPRNDPQLAAGTELLAEVKDK